MSFFCWKRFILLGWKVLLRYFIFPVVLSTLTARAKHFFHHVCSILLQSNITRVACTSITQISRNEFWRFRVLFLVVCLLNDSKATFATLLTSRGALSSHVSLGPMKELTLFNLYCKVICSSISCFCSYFFCKLTNLAACSGALVCWCLSLLPYFL